jgi:hypothetical protein
MASSLVIMTYWVLNEDKTFTFYESKQNLHFSTGLTKEFKQEHTEKLYKMFEHRVPLSGKLVESIGFTGYQYTYKVPKTKTQYTIIVALGRRMKEGKLYVQDLDDVLVMMGLQEPKPKVEQVSEN